MIKPLHLLFALPLMYSCATGTVAEIQTSAADPVVEKTPESTNPTPAPKVGIYTLEGDSLLLPPFEIEIVLSPKAEERIVSTAETIIVDVALHGTPMDTVTALEEDGSFHLGSERIEFTYGKTVRFQNL